MRWLISFIIFYCATFSAYASVVEFEWEEVEGARLYFVEIKNNESVLQRLKSKTYAFKTNLTPGRYQIRGKVAGVDASDRQSAWSEWKSFDIPPAAVKIEKSPPTTNKISTKTYLSQIPVSWAPVEGAAVYLVDIVDEKGQVTKTEKVSKPQATIQLRPGYYTFRLRAQTADGLESDPVTLPDRILVQNIPVKSPEKVEMDLEKGEVLFVVAEGAQVEASLEMQKFFGHEWYLVERKLLSTSIYEISKGLAPGRYRLTLMTKNSFGEVSQPVTKEFIQKPQEADLPR